jgi:hypothetical protein
MVPAIPPPVLIMPSDTAYWNIVRPKVKVAFERVSADQVFGTQNCKNVKLLQLFSQLFTFLTFIQDERQVDANNDSLGRDYGNKYYIDKYCIKTIKKSLLCRGFDSFTVFKAFNLYNLVDETEVTETTGGGIGTMTIDTGEIIFIIT